MMNSLQQEDTKRKEKMSVEKPKISAIVPPKLAVVGVGGAGGNAINTMIEKKLEGVKFLVCNTDAQALEKSLCAEELRIHLGADVTRGLGAGAEPEVGRQAAEMTVDEVMEKLEGVHMVFFSAGMGGGTGTGATPVLAAAARAKGILTVGVVNKPFSFEGVKRMEIAERGVQELRENVDTLLVIPNQHLFRLATPTTELKKAFAMADDVLYFAVRTFTDLMIKHGIVNLDFADVCTVMKNIRGKAMMGTGEASGENRAIEAAEKAIGGLLLDDISVKGARAALINIVGGEDITLYEIDEAISRVKQEVDRDARSSLDPAHILFGATLDPEITGGIIRVSVVATGIEAEDSTSSSSALTSAASAESPDEKTKADAAPSPFAKTSDSENSFEENFQSLGRSHKNFSMDQGHFSSFSLQEEEEIFGSESARDASEKRMDYQDFSFAKSHAPRKRSFFQRLMGLGKEKPEERQGTFSGKNADPTFPTGKPASGRGDHTSPAAGPQQDDGQHSVKVFPSFPDTSDNFNPEENLDVPAFLRQKGKNSQ